MNKVYIIMYLKCHYSRNVINFYFVNQIIVREVIAIPCDSYTIRMSSIT